MKKHKFRQVLCFVLALKQQSSNKNDREHIDVAEKCDGWVGQEKWNWGFLL